MKRLIYGVLVGILMLSLTACGGKDRQDEYPNVFDGYSEPVVLQEVQFVDPAPVDITPKTRTYLDMVQPNTTPEEIIILDKAPIRTDRPVDIFNLSNEVSAPIGCTAGVDC